MVAFHLVFDLQMFGLLPYGTTAEPFFYWHARLVAGSFLFLSGVSLWLAHGAGFRPRAFFRRWLVLVAAAGLVTLATALAFPDYYVFFGILHCLAASSLLGLAFLRLPALITAAFGAAVIWASHAMPGPAFDAPLIRFVGLAIDPPLTLDFEPLLPWFGPFLLGLAAGKALDRHGRLAWLAPAPGRLARSLAWPGQHSLAIYLIHQPLLISAVWLATKI